MSFATHESMFLDEVNPHDLFEKEASIARMPEDERKWPGHMLSELYKQLPFLSKHTIDIDLSRLEPEAGYALGYAMIRNASDSARAKESVGKEANRLRIPLIVEDRQLQPFHTFELGKAIYPLTKDRFEAAMLNPELFVEAVQKLPNRKSLVDQLHPPYQQRQGFGLSSSTADVPGLSKISSALGHTKEAYHPTMAASSRPGSGHYSMFSDEWLQRFQGTPFHKEAMALQEKEAKTAADNARRRAVRLAYQAKEAEFDIKVAEAESKLAEWKFKHRNVPKSETLQKLAHCGREDRSWADEFRDSPLHKTAMALSVEGAQRNVERMKRSLADQRTWQIEEALSAEAAELDAKVAAWKYQQEYGEKMASVAGEVFEGAEKTASSGDPVLDRMNRNPVKGTIGAGAAGALAGGAIGLLSKGRKGAAIGAGIGAGVVGLGNLGELALRRRWARQQGAEKEAQVNLFFTPGNRVLGTQVLPKVKGLSLAPGIMPNDIYFHPLPGSNYIVGLHKSVAEKVYKAKGQLEVRKILVQPMMKEMLANRGGRRSPGLFILLTQDKKGVFQYHKPTFVPGMQMGQTSAVDQAMQKKASKQYREGERGFFDALPNPAQSRRGAVLPNAAEARQNIQDNNRVQYELGGKRRLAAALGVGTATGLSAGAGMRLAGETRGMSALIGAAGGLGSAAGYGLQTHDAANRWKKGGEQSSWLQRLMAGKNPKKGRK